MNVVIICSDTFRHDHLGFRKLQPVLTPNLDALAAESACFADFRLCSYPTVVNRIEVFSGRYTFPIFNWGPQPYQYPVISEVFKRHGFTTALFADNLHIMQEGWNFERGFDVVRNVPGQVHDKFQPDDAPMADLPCPEDRLEGHGRRLERYRRNNYYYRKLGTTTTEVLFKSAIEWLGKPPEKFFLWLDAFDPHQPWDAPDEYLKPYPWDPNGGHIIWPESGDSKIFTKPEIANMRSLYRAEVSQIDRWVGKLMDQLRAKGLLQNTVVMFCSDHGVYFDEHGLIGKSTVRSNGRPTPFYEPLSHVPLLIRHPAGLQKGQVLDGLTQPPDLFPTALEFAGIPRVEWLQGHSLVPRLSGQAGAQKLAVGGSFPIKKGWIGCVAVWTDEWCLMYNPLNKLEGSELFNRQTDPDQLTNVMAQHPDIARKLYEQMVAWFESLGASDARKKQLTANEGFPRVFKFGYNAMLWKKRAAHWLRYRNYATGR